MRKRLHEIGVSAFCAGLLAGLLWIAYCAWIWFTVIVPWAWARGDFFPATASIVFLLLVGGLVLASVTDEERKP